MFYKKSDIQILNKIKKWYKINAIIKVNIIIGKITKEKGGSGSDTKC